MGRMRQALESPRRPCLVAYHPWCMGAPASGGARRARDGLRLCLLTFASLVIGHEVAYHVHHGAGAEFDARMTALGHDAFWPAFALLALSGAIVLGLLAAARLLRLWLRIRALSAPPQPAGNRAGSYRRSLARIWAIVFPATAIGFAIQENIEHAVAGAGLIGLDALGGHAYPMALPVLALVTLLVAAVGAALRWHAASLEARISRALWQRLLRPTGRTLRPVAWLIVSALCANAWIHGLNRSVRAPPATLGI